MVMLVAVILSSRITSEKELVMETIRDYKGDRYIVVGRGPVRPADHPHARFIMPYAVWGEKTTPGPGYRTETTNWMEPDEEGLFTDDRAGV